MKIYPRKNKLDLRYLLLIPIALVLAVAPEVKAQTPPPPPAGAPGPPPTPEQLFKKINPFGKSKSRKAKRSNNDSALPTPPGAPPADPLHLFSKKKGR